MDIERDYYAVLGVGHSADEKEIRRAYRTLVRRYHPDVAESEAATILFRQIQEAYEVVGDEARRKDYDRLRKERGLTREAGLALSATLSHRVLPALSEDQLIYALLAVGPSEAADGRQAPLNLAFVLDRSTSMKGRKLRCSRDAIDSILESLGRQDSISLVVFSDRAEVVQSSSKGASRERLQMLMREIKPSGGTELLQGLNAGIGQIHGGWSPESINHIVLLTDGRTYGDAQECLARARDLIREGIGLTVVGIGDDWDDELIDGIAEGSGGKSIYVDSPEAIAKAVLQSVQGLQRAYAPQVKMILRLSEGTKVRDAFKVAPEISRLPDNQGDYALGGLGLDSRIQVLLEIVVSPMSEGEHNVFQVEVLGDIPSLNLRQERLKGNFSVAFAPIDGSGSEGVPDNIAEALRRLIPFRLQEQALSDLEKGNVERATRRLEAAATRLLGMGEDQLAKTMLIEANTLRRTGALTGRGRKMIKYGTKSLSSHNRRDPE